MGRPIIKLDLHPNRSKRLDKVRLTRKHQSGMIGIKDGFGNGIEDVIPNTPVQHANDTPNSRFGAVLTTKPGGQRDLIEHRRGLVGRQA